MPTSVILLNYFFFISLQINLSDPPHKYTEIGQLFILEIVGFPEARVCENVMARFVYQNCENRLLVKQAFGGQIN